MNIPGNKLLVCTNGVEESRPGIDYGIHLAEALRMPIHLLGIDEKSEHSRGLRELLKATAQKLEGLGILHEVEIIAGQSEVVIPQRAAAGDFITVVGRLARPFWRQWVVGRSFRTLLAEMTSPLFYVPKAQWPIRRALICAGGLMYAFSLERLAFRIAQVVGAEVTLMHVVQPANLDYPLAHNIQDHWQTLLQTDTPQGRNLRTGLRMAQEAGLEAKVKLRRGNVVHEILQEFHSGSYDLIGMGSAYSTHSLRHLYLPNVTADIAESVDVPLLTVRSGWGEEPGQSGTVSP